MGADARNIIGQQFNTTTSMGRLTLNVLLSFAQFEREVTAERIRVLNIAVEQVNYPVDLINHARIVSDNENRGAMLTG